MKIDEIRKRIKKELSKEIVFHKRPKIKLNLTEINFIEFKPYSIHSNILNQSISEIKKFEPEILGEFKFEELKKGVEGITLRCNEDDFILLYKLINFYWFDIYKGQQLKELINEKLKIILNKQNEFILNEDIQKKLLEILHYKEIISNENISIIKQL